ncbi:MAG: hypothetical protein WCT28_02870 [Patescibacteria group bacterium]|jgi:hypothetical protein
MKSSLFLVVSLFASGCEFFRGTDNGGTEYMVDRMIDLGCFKDSPCSFISSDGPSVYKCTEDVPDHSVRSAGGEIDLDLEGVVDFHAELRPHYIIYSDGTGEPDTDRNRGVLLVSYADPEMLELSAIGTMLQCGHLVDSDADYEKFSCIVSSCIAFVEQNSLGDQRIKVQSRTPFRSRLE